MHLIKRVRYASSRETITFQRWGSIKGKGGSQSNQVHSSELRGTVSLGTQIPSGRGTEITEQKSRETGILISSLELFLLY